MVESSQSSGAYFKAASCYYQLFIDYHGYYRYCIEISQPMLKKVRQRSPFGGRDTKLMKQDQRSWDSSGYRQGSERSKLAAQRGAPSTWPPDSRF